MVHALPALGVNGLITALFSLLTKDTASVCILQSCQTLWSAVYCLVEIHGSGEENDGFYAQPSLGWKNRINLELSNKDELPESSEQRVEDNLTTAIVRAMAADGGIDEDIAYSLFVLLLAIHFKIAPRTMDRHDRVFQKLAGAITGIQNDAYVLLPVPEHFLSSSSRSRSPSPARKPVKN